MDIFVALLATVHVIAFLVSASNGIMQMVTGAQMSKVSSETRQTLYVLQDVTARLGKISMGVLVVSGLAILWLRWNFTAPNAWFWLKMAGFAAMVVFIALGERHTAASRIPGPAMASAIKAKQMLGKATSLAMLIVVYSAFMTFS